MLENIVIAEKTKLVIMAALAGILGISLLLNIRIYGAKKMLEQELQYSKAENASLTKKLDDLRKEHKRLQEQLEMANNDLKKVTREKEALQKEEEDLKKEYDKAVKEKDELTDKLKAQALFTDENAALKQQLGALSEGRAGLEKRIKQLSEEKSGLELKIKEMEAEKEPSIELPPIVVSPKQERDAAQDEPAGPLRQGSILSVNEENNFVIIDLGADEGIKTGDILSVYRENQLIAAIEALQTRKSISACDIKKEIRPIQAGDTVK